MAKPASWAQTTGCGKLNAVPGRCLVATFQPQHMPSRAVYGHLLRLNRLPNAPQACLLLWATRAWTCKYSREPVAEIPVLVTKLVWIRPKPVWVDPRSFPGCSATHTRKFMAIILVSWEVMPIRFLRMGRDACGELADSGDLSVPPIGDVAVRCRNGDPSVFRSLFKA